MKKIILLFTFIFSISAFSQIKVLKNETLSEVGNDNSVSLFKKDNKYTFNYQDVANSNLNSFRSFYFYDLNNDFEQLYKLISDGFINMPTSEIEMEFPMDIIGLNFGRNYGQVTVQFVHYIGKNRKYVGKSQYLTKKQIDKIFGKDKKYSNSSNQDSNVNTGSKTTEKATVVNKTSTKTPVKTTKKPVKKTIKR